jgi:hypothetical protein
MIPKVLIFRHIPGGVPHVRRFKAQCNYPETVYGNTEVSKAPMYFGSKTIVGHSLALSSGGNVITSHLLAFLGPPFEDSAGD